MERWLEQTIDAEDSLLNRTRQELPDVDRIPATPLERDDLAGGPLIQSVRKTFTATVIYSMSTWVMALPQCHPAHGHVHQSGQEGIGCLGRGYRRCERRLHRQRGLTTKSTSVGVALDNLGTSSSDTDSGLTHLSNASCTGLFMGQRRMILGCQRTCYVAWCTWACC